VIQINICEDFTKTPWFRYKHEGNGSGEEFRDTLLVCKLNDAEIKGEKLEIIFDGTYGFSMAFLEEAFGGFIRKYGKNPLRRIELISKEDETIPGIIKNYISAAKKQQSSNIYKKRLLRTLLSVNK